MNSGKKKVLARHQIYKNSIAFSKITHNTHIKRSCAVVQLTQISKIPRNKKKDETPTFRKFSTASSLFFSHIILTRKSLYIYATHLSVYNTCASRFSTIFPSCVWRLIPLVSSRHERFYTLYIYILTRASTIYT